MTDDAYLGWWAISGEMFLAALRRAHAGEDPDLLYIEYHANSDHETVGDDDDR